MPAARPPEFRGRALELALSGQHPVAHVAPGPAPQLHQLPALEAGQPLDPTRVDVIQGHPPAQARLADPQITRRTRVLEMENEILKRASAFFARENVLPK